MNQHNQSLSPRTLVEITDEEHTLILMMRTMRLDEITCVMKLNNFLPKELSNKCDHIMNIINFHFHKSYEIHVVKTVIEFISTHPIYNQMFQQHSLNEMIQKYQENKSAQSEGVYELYLKPYTTQCIQCKKQLKQIFSHRSKSVMSLTRTYKARM
jgi:hypothetical protein